MNHSTRLGIAIGLSFILMAGCGGDGGASPGDGGVPDSAKPDGGNCPAGQQDVNDDGTCNPDCASTPCDHGTCSEDGSTGLAACACEAGYRGDACDELDTPASGSLSFWLDAADATTMTVNGSAVEAWADKGQDELDSTLQSDVFAPELVSDGLNGLPIVRFDPTGNGKYLHWDGLGTLADSEYTIFMVVRINSGSELVFEGDGTTQAVELNATSSSIQLVHDADPEANQVIHGTSFYGDAGYSTGEFHLLTLQRTKSELAIWVDGNYRYALPSASATDISEALDVYVGANPAVSQVFDGDLAEMIVVPEGLIYQGRKPIEDYLAAKWFGSAFERNPTAFGVARIWLDADQPATLTTLAGDAVSNWANLGLDSGFFENSTFADARPTLVSGAVGGRPAVRFDGGDALVQNDVALYGGGRDGAYTLIAVINPPSSGSSQVVFRATTAGGLEGLRLDLVPGAPNFTYQHVWPAGGAGDAIDSFAPTQDFSAPFLVKIERSAGGNFTVVYGDMNGSFSATADPILFGETLNYVIGGESIGAPGPGLVGDIAELIVLNDAPGNSEETALLGLLRAKWGL